MSPTWFLSGVEAREVPSAGMQVLPFAPEFIQSRSGVPEREVLAEGDEGRVGVVGVGTIGVNANYATPVLKV